MPTPSVSVFSLPLQRAGGSLIGLLALVVFALAWAAVREGSATEAAFAYERATVADLCERAFRGDANASYELGRRYERGLGVPRNLEEAGLRYLDAEEQGRELEPRIIRTLLAGERELPGAE